jgi:hypothetical protein
MRDLLGYSKPHQTQGGQAMVEYMILSAIVASRFPLTATRHC